MTLVWKIIDDFLLERTEDVCYNVVAEDRKERLIRQEKCLSKIEGETT